MQFGALWSITRIKGGSKGSSEPGTSHSQEAQHALVWPPCAQPPPPRGPPGLPSPPQSSQSSSRPLCWFGTWYRWQQRGTLGWSQVSTKANLHTASGVCDNTGAGALSCRQEESAERGLPEQQACWPPRQRRLQTPSEQDFSTFNEL